MTANSGRGKLGAREKRLAEALRKNLKRRKEAGPRAKTETTAPAPSRPAMPSEQA